MRIGLADSRATEAFGCALAPLILPGDVIALHGPLGAGKTTLARGLLHGLGHEGEVPSPTFAIVQPYEIPAVRLPVAHVDLYRIEDPAELEELGLDDMLTDGALLIEWPGRLPRLWPQTLRLTLTVVDGARALTAGVPPAWGTRWPPK